MFFYALWDCNAYEKLDNFRDEAKRLKIPFELVDVETDEGVRKSIKWEVRNVPTIVYTQGGKEVSRDNGNTAYSRIQYHI